MSQMSIREVVMELLEASDIDKPLVITDGDDDYGVIAVERCPWGVLLTVANENGERKK